MAKCPLLKKECLREKCEWWVKYVFKHTDVGCCALKGIAEFIIYLKVD